MAYLILAVEYRIYLVVVLQPKPETNCYFAYTLEDRRHLRSLITVACSSSLTVSSLKAEACFPNADVFSPKMMLSSLTAELFSSNSLLSSLSLSPRIRSSIHSPVLAALQVQSCAVFTLRNLQIFQFCRITGPIRERCQTQHLFSIWSIVCPISREEMLLHPPHQGS